MELVAYFDKFLKEEVNLNQSRIDSLKEKEDTILKFIKDSETFKDLFLELIPQGSKAHKTIIKPARENQEFDVDYILLLVENTEWEPKDYIDELHQIFKDNGNYKDIVKRKNRCVVIKYSRHFHIDIVPAIKIGDYFNICNRGTNKFEKDNPIKFKEWFFDKHKEAYYQLIKCVRLFKYLRDRKCRFKIESILLNTLLGNLIKCDENESDFKNIPTAFYQIFKRLNDYLQANSIMPSIYNPVLQEEDLTSRNWNQDDYSNFQEKINQYFNAVKEAYDEKNKEQSIEKWRVVFGDEFPNEVEKSESDLFLIGAAKSNKPWGY